MTDLAGQILVTLHRIAPDVDPAAVAAHPTVVATLAADHRVSDGHRGGLYLAAIDHLLQEPDKL